MKTKPLFALLIILSALIIWGWPYLPEKDSLSYFNFSDDREIWGVLNALNVLSNLIFLLVGFIGLNNIYKNQRSYSFALTLFGTSLAVAIILTAFGSAYFHWNPNLETLMWDRLPMTLGFVSITSLIIADRINEKLSLYFFVLLIPLGIISVLGYNQHWLSLRPYLLVQFGSILFIVLAAIIYKEGKLKNSIIWSTIGLYIVAKVFESADEYLWNATGVISGHTLKHLFAGFAIYKILSFYQTKREG